MNSTEVRERAVPRLLDQESEYSRRRVKTRARATAVDAEGDG